MGSSSSSSIRKEMQAFQASVQKLGIGISDASSLWKDEKFSELSSSVTEIANRSRSVLIAGDRCCASIDRFEAIAAEQY